MVFHATLSNVIVIKVQNLNSKLLEIILIVVVVQMQKIILDADTHGLGDLCVSSFISEGSKLQETQLVHFATGDNKRILEMFGQEISKTKENAITIENAYKVELKEKGKIDRILTRSYELGIFSQPARPTAIFPKSAIHYASIQRKNKNNPLIMLFPEVAWTTREWPASYWIDLAFMLYELDYDVRIFTQHRNVKFDSLKNVFYDQDIINLAALMKHASVVVGNDSGPVHLAGTLDVPTLVLCGPTTETCFSHMQSVQTLSSNYYCTGCYFSTPFRPACDQGCKSLFMLDAKIVVKRIKKMLKPKSFFKQLFM